MASIYDKSSLVLIPSGTKTGKVFSQKPTNGDGDFTFTRASAATRVNADGNIEKETMNLLTNSQNFADSQYILGPNISRTTGQTDPNGGNTAVLMSNPSESNGFFYSSVSLQANTINTFSIYIKGASAGSVCIRIDDSTTGNQHNVNYTTEWTRVSCYELVDQVSCLIIIGGYGTWTAGTDIQFAFAQVEQGLVARDYIETTTSAVYGGITDNVPRLDYTDSSCPALLLEPLRTNFVTSSEYFGSLNLYGSVNATYGAYTNPSGEDSAYLLEATSAISRVQTLSSSGDGNDAVMSIFIKGNSNVSYPTLANQGGGQSTRWEFDANNVLTYYDGDAPTGDYGQEDYGNGWYRIWLKTDTTNSNTNYYRFNPDNRYGTGSLYAWGFQVEKNSSYATSYIPTYGSSVSRVGELSSVTGVSDLIGQTEGTIFFEWSKDVLNLGNGYSYFQMGDYPNYVGIYIQASNCICEVVNSGAVQARIVKSSVGIGTHKAAVTYANNDIAFYFDGVQVGVDSLATIPSTSVIRLNANNGIAEKISQSLIFKTRLSNQELQDLTTL